MGGGGVKISRDPTNLNSQGVLHMCPPPLSLVMSHHVLRVPNPSGHTKRPLWRGERGVRAWAFGLYAGKRTLAKFCQVLL